MSIDYQRIKTQTAERLIRENGRTAYITGEGEPTGPDWNPQPGEPIREPVSFVQTRYSMTNRNESLVQVGDIMGIISTEGGFVPEKSKHKMEIDGKEYSFIDVQPLKPGAVVMLWKFHVRR